MAVYTDISDAQLVEYLAQYDLGELLSCKGIAEGVENSNFLLHLSDAPYILTLYEQRVSKDDLPFFMGLMEHLAEKGFTCPMPVHMKNNQVIGELSGRPSAIVTFLEGMGVRDPNPDQCVKAGRTMARLHEAAADFQIVRKNALDPAGWQPLLDGNIHRADEVEPGLASLIKQQYRTILDEWPDDLPSGVIHADFFKDNVFFLNDDVSGVIDFYFACNDILAYDLAIGINAWCFSDSFNFQPELALAFVEGYQSVRELSSEEKRALPTLMRGGALRFLSTRLNDWLNVPADALVLPHNPKAFSARLRFFANFDDISILGLA